MRELRYTLVADGSSDRSLMPILGWLLRQSCDGLPIQGAFSDLRRLRPPPRSLSDRISRSVELYPCDVLFIHRDAEGASLDERLAEIEESLKEARVAQKPVVCVIPVRMTEAWLLIDEAALRRAAGNPNGKQPLNLPSVARLEGLSDPKRVLYGLLRQASGFHGRRLKSLNRKLSGHRVADFIRDFRPLYRLTAFQRLAADVARTAQERGWSHSE